jgi:SAM-dependent methyltransferase
MHGGAGRHYYAVGLSALRCLEEALGAAASPGVDSLLDLPCGHGRVLRWLTARYPQARLTACDVDDDGVAYCAAAFGASPARSLADFDALDLGARFDLIWCGSLATHLDERRIGQLLAFFRRHLAPRGVLVLTTHGERAAENLRSGRLDYLLSPPQVASLLEAYSRSGFGYADYPGEPGYGVSLSSPAWVQGRAVEAGLREVWSRPAGWDGHQDVFALTPGPIGA